MNWQWRHREKKLSYDQRQFNTWMQKTDQQRSCVWRWLTETHRNCLFKKKSFIKTELLINRIYCTIKIMTVTVFSQILVIISFKKAGPDWYEILMADADADIRERENSNIRNISRYYTQTVYILHIPRLQLRN